MRRCRWLLVCLLAVARGATADDLVNDSAGGKKDITEVSLDDLLKVDTSVATKVPTTFRETPGVITVITREEIMDSGARDLQDVLMLVPGFSPGVDVQGVVDFGVRGNWGHEGKILLLVDGQPMNETLFSDNELGNHYPVDQIERVEIIRGPGSVIYGGFAELAVINVITRGADELKGAAVYFEGGWMAHAAGHANVSVAVGDTMGKLKLSIAGLFGYGHRSDQTFTDFYGGSYSLANAQMSPTFINVGIRYDALSARFIFDRYRSDEGDGLSQNEAQIETQRFTGFWSEVRYDAKANDKLTLTPKVNYQRQLPWQMTDQSSPVFYDKTGERLTGSLLTTYKVQPGLDLLAGLEAYWDHAYLNEPAVANTAQGAFGNGNDVAYVNEAVFAQGLWNNSIANVTVGARYEHHSEFGSSFVPRIAVTKLVEPFHFKLLYSEAFRAPGFEDINLEPTGTSIQPEHVYNAEAEVGYSINSHNFITLNAFYTYIHNAIVYFVPTPTTQGYTNFDRVSTAGVEADYKLRYSWGYFDLNYSFYRAVQNDVPLYAIPGHNDLLRGMPQHKVTLHGAWRPWRELRIAPTIIAYSGAYGALLPGDGMGNGMVAQADTTFIANLFVTYRNLLAKGTEIGIGGYNLFDSKILFIQPYDAGHAPLPGASREFLLRLGYSRQF